jgi:hypothetical protein
MADASAATPATGNRSLPEVAASLRVGAVGSSLPGLLSDLIVAIAEVVDLPSPSALDWLTECGRALAADWFGRGDAREGLLRELLDLRRTATELTTRGLGRTLEPDEGAALDAALTAAGQSAMEEFDGHCERFRRSGMHAAPDATQA